MNWTVLFLRTDGRIGRGRFWIGFAILAAAQGLASLAPSVGWFAFMVLTYAWICIYAKRLHDIGRSGWLTMAPILFSLIALSIAAATFWQSTFDGKPPGTTSPSWLCLGVLIVAALIDLGFVAWVGLSPSDEGENVYGPGLGEPDD